MNWFINLLIDFSFERFLASFEYMGKGMLGIFIVITILVLGISLLNKATTPKEKKNENESNE